MCVHTSQWHVLLAVAAWCLPEVTVLLAVARQVALKHRRSGASHVWAFHEAVLATCAVTLQKVKRWQTKNIKYR